MHKINEINIVVAMKREAIAINKLLGFKRKFKKILLK